jgi:hypothetical protein
VVLAVYPNGAQGIPRPAPGRVVLAPAYQQISGSAIANGTTSIFSIAGNGGIPIGALGIAWSASFTSATAGTYVQFGPHGASNLGAYQTLGNLPAANSYVNGGGLLQLDSNGKIDIKANNGNCTVNFYTQGYVL